MQDGGLRTWSHCEIPRMERRHQKLKSLRRFSWWRYAQQVSLCCFAECSGRTRSRREFGSEVMIIPNLITESLETGRNLSNSQVDFVVQTIRRVGTRSLIREFVVKCISSFFLHFFSSLNISSFTAHLTTSQNFAAHLAHSVKNTLHGLLFVKTSILT